MVPFPFRFILVDSVKPDIIIGTETWLDKDIRNSEICPRGYVLHPYNFAVGVIILGHAHCCIRSLLQEVHLHLFYLFDLSGVGSP
jgi:hypothetical protein